MVDISWYVSTVKMPPASTTGRRSGIYYVVALYHLGISDQPKVDSIWIERHIAMMEMGWELKVGN